MDPILLENWGFPACHVSLPTGAGQTNTVRQSVRSLVEVIFKALKKFLGFVFGSDVFFYEYDLIPWDYTLEDQHGT